MPAALIGIVGSFFGLLGLIVARFTSRPEPQDGAGFSTDK